MRGVRAGLRNNFLKELSSEVDWGILLGQEFGRVGKAEDILAGHYVAMAPPCGGLAAQLHSGE